MSWVAGELATTLIEKLSTRQREVLKLASRGLTNPEIGAALCLSVETVRTHIHAVIHRLGVSNRTEAAAISLAYDTTRERAEREQTRPAIGVLPLITLSAEPRHETIAQSLTRELMALYSRWCWFPVIANASTCDARSLGKTSQEIGTQLGARFLVDAALCASATHLRITAGLTDTANGHCLWTDSYEVPHGDWQRMHDPICQTIVAATYPQLIATVHAGLPRGIPSEDLDAWVLTQQALFHWQARDRGGNALAQAGFAMAIAREPTLVLAHFGLGLSCHDELVNQWGPERPARERLAGCAERCIALAPHQAEGYYLLGRYCQTLGRHEDAIAPLQLAVGYNPSFAEAHALLGQLLLSAGRSDEGLSHIRHACRLGPRAFLAELSAAYFGRAEYGLALTTAEAALAQNPRYPYARILAAAAAFWIDERARAASHRHALLAMHPAFSLDGLRRTFGASSEAVSRITQALERLAARSSAYEH